MIGRDLLTGVFNPLPPPTLDFAIREVNSAMKVNASGDSPSSSYNPLHVSTLYRGIFRQGYWRVGEEEE